MADELHLLLHPLGQFLDLFGRPLPESEPFQPFHRPLPHNLSSFIPLSSPRKTNWSSTFILTYTPRSLRQGSLPWRGGRSRESPEQFRRCPRRGEGWPSSSGWWSSPDPFGPRRPRIVPRGWRGRIRETAVCAPKLFVTPESRTTGSRHGFHPCWRSIPPVSGILPGGGGSDFEAQQKVRPEVARVFSKPWRRLAGPAAPGGCWRVLVLVSAPPPFRALLDYRMGRRTTNTKEQCVAIYRTIFYGDVTVGTGGRMTIPLSMRERCGIQEEIP